MKKIFLLPNVQKDPDLAVSSRVAQTLCELGIEVFASSEFAHKISGSFCSNAPDASMDAIIVVGGDGTVIDAAGQALYHDLPIFGINLGHLGYLTELDPDNLSELARLRSDDFTVERKMLLEVTRGGNASYERLALNEVCLMRPDRKICVVRARVDGGEWMQYRCDGLVVATPVGSTGYALSAGGPIISHEVPCLSLLPICPHSFFNRALLLPREVEIELENASDEVVSLMMDGREAYVLSPFERVSVRASERELKMISFSGSRMLSTLIEKMKRIEMI